MMENASITYIKNGIEKSITLSKFDEFALEFKLRDIFEIKVLGYGIVNKTKGLELRNDITLVHMKKCVIDDYSYIYGIESEGVELILEDCIFKRLELNIEGINKVKVLNPRWKGKRYCSLKLLKIKSLDVVLGEETEQGYKLEILVSEVDKFRLDSAIYLSELFIMERVKNIHLRNFVTNQITSLRIRDFDGILTLENSHINVDRIWLEEYLYSGGNNFNLNLINSSINSDNNENNFLEKVNNLSLIDSTIILNNDILLDKLVSIYLKRSSIRSSGDMYFCGLNEVIFDDQDDDYESILDTSSYLMVDDDKKIELRDVMVGFILNKEVYDEVFSNLSFSRLMLINVLNKYEEKLNREIEEIIKEKRRRLKRRPIKDF